MCQGTHKNAEFPVSELVNGLMKASPAEVFRGDLVEKFKANFNKTDSMRAELERIVLNGADKVREHCLELRLDVDLATETAIEEIQKQRDTFSQENQRLQSRDSSSSSSLRENKEWVSKLYQIDGRVCKRWKELLDKGKDR